MTRHGHRVATIAGLIALAAAGCDLDTKPPRVGPLVGSAPPPAGLVVKLTDAGVAGDHVWVELEVTEDDLPLDGEALAELRPAFTLAGLGREPVSGLPAWRSYLPLGPQRIPRLPVAGPGTPEEHVLVAGIDGHDGYQPGAEEAQPEDLGGGRFRHVFATALPAGFSPAETRRVGVFMQAVSGNAAATSTLDFVSGGVPPASREVVTDADCAACHGVVRGHGATRMGVAVCVTCHTFQLADPDTKDPAALSSATALTDPNPLEFGRLVHRIHRGRNLPTLYRASPSVVPAPALPFTAAPPLPFFPGRNAVEPGRRFAVVSEHGHVRTFGEIMTRTDNGAAPRNVAGGLWFPRDYRDCAVCHARAADAPAVLAGDISRRTCAGCHPETWFGAGPASLGAGTAEPVHFAHPGGPQADDLGCAECHVRGATTPSPTWLAPLDEVHVSPLERTRANLPRFEILEVRDLRPGLRPTIVYRVSDRSGLITPLEAPDPPMDATPVAPSPVPRRFPPGATGLAGISFTLGGPMAGGPAEYMTGTYSGVYVPITESVPASSAADAQGRFTYTMTNAVPAAATGTWAVMMAGRRAGATQHYSIADGRFGWPYTGETVTEAADQADAWVDVAIGTWSAESPTPSGRRAVVDPQKCNACHGRLALHGTSRNSIAGCLVCHTPDRTDWNRRPKDAGGNVNLAATYDGLEEQTVHFKVMVHRIHTGTREGSATIETFDPYVIYGFGGTPFFFAQGTFPDDLAACDRCHLDGTWRIDGLPADAGATIANETPTIVHTGTLAHDHDPAVLPMQASCTSCHANAFAAAHAARNTVNGKEGCVACHGTRGSKSVDRLHGVE